MKRLKNNLFSLFLSLLLLTIIILSSLIIVKHKDASVNGLIFGNEISDNSDYSELPNCNKSFLNKNLPSTFLYKMVSQDASKIENDKVVKLSTTILKSDYIIIQLGDFDFQSKISYSSKDEKLIYDADVLLNQIQITTTMYNNIINDIKKINDDINVISVGLTYSYSIVDDFIVKVINKCNEIIGQITSSFKGIFTSSELIISAVNEII